MTAQQKTPRKLKTPRTPDPGADLDALGPNAVRLVALVGEIKGPVQLAGFLFSVFAAALIQFVDPGNTQALVIVGAISVALISIPLLFRPEILKMFKADHRPVVVLATLLLLLASFGILATVTYQAVAITLRPAGALFDSALADKDVRVVGPRPDGKYRVEIIWSLFPLSKSAAESASVFAGMAVLHDDDLVEAAGMGAESHRACGEVKSCLGHRVFHEYGRKPLLVKGGTKGTTLTTVIDVSRKPKRLRIWWQFYQREGGSPNVRCVVDEDTPGVSDGIPPLVIRTPHGRSQCYMSYGQRVIEL